jgi:hypothetical protein
MNNPRFVLFLLKIVEIIKRRMIIRRLMEAINEPIIVSQFLDEGGSFMIISRFSKLKVKLGK